MSDVPNPYVLLGVDRGATTGEIRAAYLKLIKRHHPDISQRGADGGEAFAYVANLNAAFAILRDHRRRAEYDMQLYAASAKKGRAVNYPVVIRQRPRHYAGRLQALIAVGLTVSAFVAVFFLDPLALPSPVDGTGEFGITDLANQGADPSVTLDPGDARRMVSAATSLPSGSAVESSRRCFIDAMAVKRPEIAASCVVFDNAVLLWNWRGGGDGSIAPYFQLANARSRHLDALAVWSDDRDEVLDRLWSATVDVMVDEVRSTLAEPAPPELVARANAGVAKTTVPSEPLADPILARP